MPDTERLFHFDYQIRWQGYRAFADTGWITIKPITILIGPNNCGKSSTISPLLLLRQTVGSPDLETALISKGFLSDVGGYRDYVHQHRISQDVRFSIRYHTHPITRRIKDVGNYPPGAVQLTFASNASDRQNAGVKLKGFELYDIYNRPYLRVLPGLAWV